MPVASTKDPKVYECGLLQAPQSCDPQPEGLQSSASPLLAGNDWYREVKPLHGLPVDAKARKALPLFTYYVEYFPDAMIAECEVAVAGNLQHNPGEPLHWAREKSTDQMDCAFRHMLDHARGILKDTDGQYHLAKARWRLGAELQLAIEKERGVDKNKS